MTAKRVWIIDEGSQGHLVQSRGMVRELAKAVPVEVSEIRIHPVLPSRWGRSLAKRLLRSHPHEWLFRRLYPKVGLCETRPDLIVSSGPHSLTALEFLAKHHGCPSVFLQGTLHVPEGAVTAIMRPFEGQHRADYIFIPLLFTEITPELVEAEGKRFLAENGIRPAGSVNALFIGNSSAKIRFSMDDWDAIIRFVNNLWKSTGSQWLITTSYRTGRDLEDRLRRGIEPDAILSAVWYSRVPSKVTKPFLGIADRVFVTMDSLTMLTEAVASGRPACALCPAELKEESPNTHLRYIRDLADKGLISRLRPDLDPFPPSGRNTVPEINYADAIEQLLTRIRWNA